MQLPAPSGAQVRLHHRLREEELQLRVLSEQNELPAVLVIQGIVPLLIFLRHCFVLRGADQQRTHGELQPCGELLEAVDKRRVARPLAASLALSIP